MPPPNNNQAATTDYGTAYNEFGSVYDPQVGQVNTQIAALAPAQAKAQTQLDQAKTNAFTNNALTSNARGIMYSGYTPQQNTAYTTNTYNPAVDKLQTYYTNQKQTLQQKITDLNQQRANDANTLVQNTKQAQAQAAAAAASARSRGGSGGAGGGSGASSAANANAMRSELARNTGKDGYVSPEDYAAAYIDWINHGGTSSSFNSTFGNFKNPKNGYYNYAITSALKRG